MNDAILGFIVATGIFWMGVFANMAILYDEINLGNEVQAAVKECELTLPRNQICVPVFSAVPEEKENE